MDIRPNRSLSQVAYDELRRRIIRSVMSPGQWVTEKGLAEELHLGLSPVRMALARLSNEGLLITMPRRGYRVSALTLKSADDLFAAWKLLACEIMRLATVNMTTEALATHQELVERARIRQPTPGRDQIDMWLLTGHEQWQFFARVADNEYLTDIYERLDSQLARVFSLTFSNTLEVGFGDRHKWLQRMLRNRDVEGVVRETARFLDKTHRDTRRSLTSTAASSAIDLAI